MSSEQSGVCLPLLFAVQLWVCCSSSAAEIGQVREEYGACAENSLFSIAELLGKDVSYSEIQRLVDPDGDQEASLEDIAAAAERVGLASVGVDLGVHGSAQLKSPSILHFRRQADDSPGNHFVVYLGRTPQGKVCILDPPRVPMLLAEENLAKLWTGKALVICPSQQEAADYRHDVKLNTRSIIADPLSWCALSMLVLCVLFRPRRVS